MGTSCSSIDRRHCHALGVESRAPCEWARVPTPANRHGPPRTGASRYLRAFLRRR
ncbi:hypothetical protein NJ7G_0081 [Natrinema sp. J7-2]|nr:hypothetical protein NJ7G_0081 [Natrinema sp. J7-2]